MNKDLKSHNLTWKATGDAEYPYEVYYDSKRYIIRVNDFPAEPFYSLVEGGDVLEDFDDWPGSWQK